MKARTMAITEITADLISRKQLATELGERLRGKPYSEFTLMAWERDNKGPPITRIGRDVFYNLASVEKWLRSLEAGAAR